MVKSVSDSLHPQNDHWCMVLLDRCSDLYKPIVPVRLENRPLGRTALNLAGLLWTDFTPTASFESQIAELTKQLTSAFLAAKNRIPRKHIETIPKFDVMLSYWYF